MLAAACVVVLCGLGRTTYAEVEGPYGMKVGAGSRLVLGLGVGTRYTDNIFHQENNEQSSWGLFVRPSALLLTDRGNFHLQLGASAEAAAFDFQGDADDYVDAALSSTFKWSPLTRHRFTGGLYWNFDHDPFGTRRTEGSGLLNRQLDRWEQRGGNIVYRFGAPEATVNFETELSGFERDYTTNRSATRFLDFNLAAVRGTVFYKISPKTRLLAEVISGEVDYDNVAPGFASRAADFTRYRVGAQWIATGKLTGTAKVGKLERDFDAPSLRTVDKVDWDVKVNWDIRARDRLSFAVGRDLEESFLNTASTIDSLNYQLGWTHDWTSMLRSSLIYRYNDLDFEGISRRDDNQALTLGLDYNPSRHWSLFGDISYRTRDSTAIGRDYDQTMISAGIRLTY